MKEVIKIFCIVCGMKIDKDNAFISNNVLLQKNTTENVNACPFCGAPSYYLRETYERNHSSSLNETEEAILDHAMKLEVFNAEFYKEAASRAVDKDISEMFKTLSKVEMIHANIHKRLGGFKALPQLTTIDYSRLQTDLMLIKEASIREEHAVNYYEKYLTAFRNDNIKMVLNALKEIEGEHISLLKISL